MTGALISGAAGVAVFQQGGELWCIRPASISPQPVSPGLLPYLFDTRSDGIYYPEATPELTARLLENACSRERCIQLVLLSMDPISCESTRQLAEEALEELLEEPYISEFVENSLFSNPLPDGTVWIRARSSVAFDACPLVRDIKRAVVGAQEAIRRVRTAWDSLPMALFSTPENRIAFESALIETGAFRILAIATSSPDHKFSKGNAQVSLLADSRYRAFHNFRSVLVEWTRQLPRHVDSKAQSVPDGDDDEEVSGPRNRSQRVPTYEAFQRVVARKEAIIDQLGRRNLGRVDIFVGDLVRDQLAGGQADLAAKSLCDLAKRAKDLGFPEYQLAWSRRATEINPADPFVHAQFADALLSQGDLTSALEAYESTVRDFPQHVVARTGQAEVLKAMGRLPQALDAYEGAVRDFPENVVARTGQAEVLKAMGRLRQALEAYEGAARDFPENVVARTGQAEVLKAMGRLPQALDAYEGAVRDFPQDVVARNGQAEVLKAIGRLPQALEAYESAVRDFPENVVARTGQAEVLKAMGRLPQALDAYEGAVRDFPQDVVARNGQAEVLKAIGRLPQALEAYESAVRDFPQDVVARSGQAEVLKAMGRLPQALEAYEGAVRDFPQDAVVRNGQATVFLFLGRYEEALKLVPAEKPETRQQWIALHIRASIRMKQGQYAQADELLSTGTVCPWPEARSRFIASRALLRVRTKKLKEADEIIRSEQSLECKVIRIDIYRRLNRIGDARSVLREIRGCQFAKIVEISRDLEKNMESRKRTVSDDEFVEREFALLLAS